jgi:hypothetical protein
MTYAMKRVQPSPQMSDDRADKVWAALHYDIAAEARRGAPAGRETYARAPFYWDAVEAWFNTLNGCQLESVDLIRDIWSQFGDRRPAILQHLARILPPVPKMPEQIAETAASWHVS